MTTELQKIDDELARLPATPKTDEDLDARATLMARRITLDQAAKADAAANGRQPSKGNLVVVIPDSVGLSHYYARNGRVACARVREDGKRVLDLFAQDFKDLLAEKKYGFDWQSANAGVLQQLAGLSR